MAYSYIKKGNPWFYIRFKDPTGKWRSKSTRYRIDNTLHRAKATAEAARIGVNEKRTDNGHDWVDDLIENHPVCPLTKVYYKNSWRHLARFISEKKISLQAFSANDCEIYLRWRHGERMAKKGGLSLSAFITTLLVKELAKEKSR